jgi:hypothetical protein
MRLRASVAGAWFTASVLIGVGSARGGEPATPPVLRVETPVEPPTWALLERELIRAQSTACEEFFHHYFDDRGYLECVERWGGDDGPDDAIENLDDWPILYSLGAPDTIRQLIDKAWEGHLRQYTRARTTEVEFARDGMYYKEFPVKFDWLHNGEGLSVFNLKGLCDPYPPNFRRRVERFAGFYIGEDPGAPNYDPEHKIIRSMFNGSRGPLLRKATGLDWAGDPIDVENRFLPRHGERNYQEMLDHFKNYTDVIGDHPQNLAATSLALNAYMLTHDERYRSWLLDYVGAWVKRIADNGGIIPSNIGLDGKIGGSAGGKWYGGVYGWGFTNLNPATGRMISRNTTHIGLTGFSNAYLLTGDDRYLDGWRKQIDLINSKAKVENGKTLYPQMFGDKGWYDYSPEPYAHGAFEIYYWSMKEEDRRRVPAGSSGWVAYLDGKDPGFPDRALRSEFNALRQKVADMRADPTTPDTRLSDDPMPYNPATVRSLIQLMLGGLAPKHYGEPLHCRFRYFDPVERRPGLPEGVGALVESLSADGATLSLVNLNPSEWRSVVVQGGAYAEHLLASVDHDGNQIPINAPSVAVELAPGTGSTFKFTMKRYAARPTLAWPWDVEAR